MFGGEVEGGVDVSPADYEEFGLRAGGCVGECDVEYAKSLSFVESWVSSLNWVGNFSAVCPPVRPLWQSSGSLAASTSAASSPPQAPPEGRRRQHRGPKCSLRRGTSCARSSRRGESGLRVGWMHTGF